MKPTARQMEERRAWRSLAAVALPALALLPLLAVQRAAHGVPAREDAPLFTLAEEPAPRAKAMPPIPEVAGAAPPAAQVEVCILPPEPQLQPREIPFVHCGFDSRDIGESELAIDSLPAPRRQQPRKVQHPAPVAAAAEPSTTPPAYLSNPKPPYPDALRSRGIQGSVGVRIAVSPQGTPTAVDITRPSGHAEFDTTTRSWILRHWRFRPATAAGQATASTVSTTVRFQLF